MFKLLFTHRPSFKALAAASALAAALVAAAGASSLRPASAQTAAAGGPVIKLTTTQGVVLVKLYPKDAPITCANFIMLVKKHFYDGLMFHRVADLGSNGPGDGHIIQGGDPWSRHANPAAVRAAAAAQLADPNAPGPSYMGHNIGEGGSAKDIKGEFQANGVNNPLTHTAGAVAMARSTDPNSASSQFYICTTPVHGIDGSYAVFGMVIQGLDNAAKLQVGDRIVKAVVEK